MTDSGLRRSREIAQRIVVEGNLTFHTPVHLGNGEHDDFVDMPLFMDDAGNAILSGTTLAGGLRNFLREWELGYFNTSDEMGSLSERLFGAVRDNEDGNQSPLIIDDAYGTPTGIEIRDGVSIHPKWGTAKDGMKYDYEMLQAGTTFPLRFELAISADEEDQSNLLAALAIALKGIQQGELCFGLKTNRGFGQCSVDAWCVRKYELANTDHLLDYLSTSLDSESEQLTKYNDVDALAEYLDVHEVLGEPRFADHRRYFQLDANFRIKDSLIVRSGTGPDNVEVLPDEVHLHAMQSDGSWAAVVPGTSVAGALRHRALRIANTLSDADEQRAVALVESIFGSEHKDDQDESELEASRLVTKESVIQTKEAVIQNEVLWVQQRIRIDRFTGGAAAGALFNEAPVFGLSDTHLPISMRLKNPENHQIGLLLQLLKDLWTEDLPIGGESSLGRGRLVGQRAKCEFRLDHDERPVEITIEATADGVTLNGEILPAELNQRFARPLVAHLSKEETGESS